MIYLIVMSTEQSEFQKELLAEIKKWNQYAKWFFFGYCGFWTSFVLGLLVLYWRFKVFG